MTSDESISVFLNQMNCQLSIYFDTVDKQNAFGSRISGVSQASFNHNLNKFNGSFTLISFSRNTSFASRYFNRRAAIEKQIENYFVKVPFIDIDTMNVIHAKSAVAIVLTVARIKFINSQNYSVHTNCDEKSNETSDR